MTTAAIALLLAASPVGLHLDPAARQTVSFTLKHPLHTVRGVTHEVEGKALSYSDDTTDVEVVASLASFRTGSMAINEDFQELLDSPRYPNVVVRVVVPPEAQQPPGTTVEAETMVKIDLHGRSRMFPITAKISRGAAGQVSVVGHFVVELPDFGIETPRYLFLDASPTILVAFDLTWLTEAAPSQTLLNGFENAAVQDSSSGGISGLGSTAGVQDAGAGDSGSGGTASATSGATAGSSSGGGGASLGGSSGAEAAASMRISVGGSSGGGATSGASDAGGAVDLDAGISAQSGGAMGDAGASGGGLGGKPDGG